MFHSFFSVLWQGLDIYLSFRFFFSFTLLSAWMEKSSIRKILFFCCCWVSLGLVVCPRLGDRLYLKIRVKFVRLILQDELRVKQILFVRMVKLKFLHRSLAHPVESSLCANLLYSLIIWLIFSSLSPHNLHLLFCFLFPVLVLMYFVLMALFCAANRQDSFSLIRFPFFFISHVQVFSGEMSLDGRFKCL